MALASGTRIGPYEVTAQIGVGGMGEVYRATDTNLNRQVAIKVLPEAVAGDPERLARFDREAKTLAALNHPNIAAIYGLERADGQTALVMELVEGPTLADRIAQGAVPVDEALPIAKQLCEALEAAHEQGIVHRDLKPANIKVRPDGTVKVLDFGLAKLTQPPGTGPQGAGITQDPTITTPAMTQIGVLLGTAAYMSPEQAKGREVDRRSDIWAFGCVVYEMLAGKRAFDGEDMTDVLGAVVRLEPDWAALPSDVPPALRTLIRRCLEKDRRQRVSDIAAARFVLTELASLTVAPVPATTGALRPWWRRSIPAVVVAAVTAFVVGSGAWLQRPPAVPPVVTRFAFALPEGQFFSGTTRPLVAVSPDGSRVVYVANGRLYARTIGELEPREIPGANMGQPVWNPMFSPDGAAIAYAESATLSTPYTLKRIPVDGGTASTLATLEQLPADAAWDASGILISDPSRGILRLSPNGGVPELVIPLGPNEEFRAPSTLPGGAMLFTASPPDQDRQRSQIVVYSDGVRRVLIEDGFAARYLQTGHLVYAVAGTMFAVPFDVERLTITGAAVPVLAGVRRRAAVHLAVSQTGTLAYIPGPAATVETTFSLVIGDGREAPVVLGLPAAAYDHPRGSPDGRMLAVGRTDGMDSNVWIYDLSGNSALRRLTYGRTDRFPVWSADGRRVTFQSGPQGDRAIWWQPIDGGPAQRLTRPAEGEEHAPEAWSRDGRRLLFSVTKASKNFLWVFTSDGGKTEPVGTIQSAEPLSASFSPDGRWVAYAFSETRGPSGRGSQNAPDRGVYVSPFPATGQSVQVPKISSDYNPLWSLDGRSLFYMVSSSQSVVVRPVSTNPAVAFGAPVELPRGPRMDLRATDRRGFDALPDGRFVSVLPEFGEGTSATSGGEIRVVLNWFQELQRLVPTH